MGSQHFSYFRVKNFKRFKDLEVKDIGQFNLVLGDNNVGKTSLLEALMFDENFDHFILCLSKTLFDRRLFGSGIAGGIWELVVNKDALVDQADYTVTVFQTGEKDKSKEFPLAFDKRTKDLFLRNGTARFDEFINSEKFEKKNWQISNPTSFEIPGGFISPVIRNLQGHDQELGNQYSNLINNGPRKERIDFFNTLKSIDSTLLGIDYDTVSIVDKTMIAVESEKSDGRILLALQGDGFIALFRTILHIKLFRGKKLMIDEIDAGIHYSRMKEYWKVILQSAKENDVQLFATTHNKECMESFASALEELGSEFKSRARAITLKESPKTSDIRSYTNNYEVLEDSIEVGNDLR